jgi:hypothetical protein
MSNLGRSVLLASTLLALSSPVSALLMSDSEGNAGNALVNGNTYSFFPDIITAQTGSVAPFLGGCGDLFSHCDTTWTHSYGAIADPILSATLTLGIYNHGSASAGSQLASFSAGLSDLTTSMDALFESTGGALDEYNVYSLLLPAALLAELTDGVLEIALTLQGPVDGPCPLFPGPNDPPCTPPVPDSVPFNAAHLIFSTLDITIEDPIIPPDPSVPLPSSLYLLAIGGLMLARSRRRAASAQ